MGDIVWARSDRRKRNPTWPAEVINSVQDAAEYVKSVWVPGRLCVRNEKELALCICMGDIRNVVPFFGILG